MWACYYVGTCIWSAWDIMRCALNITTVMMQKYEKNSQALRMKEFWWKNLFLPSFIKSVFTSRKKMWTMVRLMQPLAAWKLCWYSHHEPSDTKRITRKIIDIKRWFIVISAETKRLWHAAISVAFMDRFCVACERSELNYFGNKISRNSWSKSAIN